MSRHVSDTRLKMMQVGLMPTIRREKGNPNKEVSINLRDLSCILDELLRRRGLKPGFKRSALTEWMIASKVGDIAFFPEKSHGAVTTCRMTARKALQNPKARWAAMHFNGRMQVERLPDGAPYLKHHNPLVYELARLNINGRVVIPWTRKYHFPHHLKALARQVMENPLAQWQITTLTGGKVRIVRVKDMVPSFND